MLSLSSQSLTFIPHPLGGVQPRHPETSPCGHCWNSTATPSKTLANLSGMPAPCHHLQQILGNEGEPLGLGESGPESGLLGW